MFAKRRNQSSEETVKVPILYEDQDTILYENHTSSGASL